MKIFAIETSCDETSVAIVEDGRRILEHGLYSQSRKHAQHGGVVPELASRMHCQHIHDLIATITLSNLKNCDAIAVTYGPGLEGSLLVGVTVARTIADIYELPLIPVNHIMGHLYAHCLVVEPAPFPYLGVIVSGGHTMLVRVDDHEKIICLAETRDDAIGECFDKVARMLGLGYPGGPIIEQEAKKYNGEAVISFPYPLLNDKTSFSFSGLKTAVYHYIDSYKQNNDQNLPVPMICASFQSVAFRSIVDKAHAMCQQEKLKAIVVCGGVSANQSLKERFKKLATQYGYHIYETPAHLCTDNAAMIGSAAYYCRSQVDRPFTVLPRLCFSR